MPVSAHSLHARTFLLLLRTPQVVGLQQEEEDVDGADFNISSLDAQLQELAVQKVGVCMEAYTRKEIHQTRASHAHIGCTQAAMSLTPLALFKTQSTPQEEPEAEEDSFTFNLSCLDTELNKLLALQVRDEWCIHRCLTSLKDEGWWDGRS